MALRTRGRYRYGDAAPDIREELLDYSRRNGYPAEHFADAACAACGGSVFGLLLDDEAGAAVRVCRACGHHHAIGDSGETLEEAEPGECECPCGSGDFEITAGAALYAGSPDARWLYLGCRCVRCGLTACYGDWKNEHPGYEELLRAV